MTIELTDIEKIEKSGTGEWVEIEEGADEIVMAVPLSMMTTELARRAIESDQNPWRILKIPEHLLTFQTCMIAVNLDGLVLKYVPKRLMTIEICITAVRQNKEAIKYVPHELRENFEKCLVAYEGWLER